MKISQEVKASTCAPVDHHDVAGGRKTVESIIDDAPVLVSVSDDDAIVFSDEVSVPSLESESDDDEMEEESEDEEEMDDEDAELDEGLAERLRILADARALKNLASAFLHPEKPVATTDGTAFGRNYFERPSATERMEDEDSDEVAEILEDARKLKKAAKQYLHPEEPVVAEDATLLGRNFFGRASAPEVEDVEDANERARVIADALALKKSAVDYLHPEVGVKSAGGACFGRNYFNRPSAPETEEDEDADKRAEILAEAAALKKSAVQYLHPEIGVKSLDATLYGRNYFNRCSAPETEDAAEANERAQVLADALALKKSAMNYLHPEVGVTSVDATSFGRNYFNRYSAPETEEDEFADERAEILAEAAALKKSAMQYLHPEVGVSTEDASLFGRNYFTRCSAPETENAAEANERAQVLADALALKKSAMNYSHPEVGVTSVDATLFGRNYFNRYCALENEEDEDADERAEILAEAAELKKAAMQYLHPEVGVSTEDATLFGRNYFTRYSAPETENAAEANERAQVLADAMDLKMSAMNYLHPEVGVASADATLFGRNYFNRPSAPETEEDEDADERAEILAEAAALKKSAQQYLHPEIGVSTEDCTLFGRNYFNRYTAPETEDFTEANERAQVLADALALKKSADAYLHPEVGVTSVDATLFGRNYFNRASAPETEDADQADECAQVLTEAAALKNSAVAYLHPEVGVTSVDATLFGRNYFNRSSAPETEDLAEANERAQVLADALALKKFAMNYLHPEVGVTSTDGACFGRNYFTRYSAPSVEVEQKASPKQDIAGDLSRLAAAVKSANLPSTKSAKLSPGDSAVGGAKKSASNVNLFGLSEEVM